VGNRVKIEAAAVEEDGEFEVITIPEAAGHFLDCLDRRVHPPR